MFARSDQARREPNDSTTPDSTGSQSREMSRALAIGLLMTLATVVLFGCGSQTTTSQETQAAAPSRTTTTIASTTSEPPPATDPTNSEAISATGDVLDEAAARPLIETCLSEPVYEPLRDSLTFEGPLDDDILFWSMSEEFDGTPVRVLLFQTSEDAEFFYGGSAEFVAAHESGSRWVVVGPEAADVEGTDATLGSLLIVPIVPDLAKCLAQAQS